MPPKIYNSYGYCKHTDLDGTLPYGGDDSCYVTHGYKQEEASHKMDNGNKIGDLWKILPKVLTKLHKAGYTHFLTKQSK